MMQPAQDTGQSVVTTWGQHWRKVAVITLLVALGSAVITLSVLYALENDKNKKACSARTNRKKGERAHAATTTTTTDGERNKARVVSGDGVTASDTRTSTNVHIQVANEDEDVSDVISQRPVPVAVSNTMPRPMLITSVEEVSPPTIPVSSSPLSLSHPFQSHTRQQSTQLSPPVSPNSTHIDSDRFSSVSQSGGTGGDDLPPNEDELYKMHHNRNSSMSVHIVPDKNDNNVLKSTVAMDTAAFPSPQVPMRRLILPPPDTVTVTETVDAEKKEQEEAAAAVTVSPRRRRRVLNGRNLRHMNMAALYKHARVDPEMFQPIEVRESDNLLLVKQRVSTGCFATMHSVRMPYYGLMTCESAIESPQATGGYALVWGTVSTRRPGKTPEAAEAWDSPSYTYDSREDSCVGYTHARQEILPSVVVMRRNRTMDAGTLAVMCPYVDYRIELNGQHFYVRIHTNPPRCMGDIMACFDDLSGNCEHQLKYFDKKKKQMRKTRTENTYNLLIDGAANVSGGNISPAQQVHHLPDTVRLPVIVRILNSIDWQSVRRAPDEAGIPLCIVSDTVMNMIGTVPQNMHHITCDWVVQHISPNILTHGMGMYCLSVNPDAGESQPRIFVDD